MNTSFKPVQGLCNSATLPLAARIQKHRRLLKIIRTALPQKLASAITDCVVAEKKLLLYCDSAAWASQLRFHGSAVMAAVNAAENEPIEMVLTRILPPVEPPSRLPHKAKTPTLARIEELRSAASCAADETLRQALARLGATLLKRYEDAAGRED